MGPATASDCSGRFTTFFRPFSPDSSTATATQYRYSTPTLLREVNGLVNGEDHPKRIAVAFGCMDGYSIVSSLLI